MRRVPGPRVEEEFVGIPAVREIEQILEASGLGVEGLIAYPAESPVILAHLRPTYPDNLFEFLATVVASRNIAWDCATGNGQAATHLARHFGQVIATDESGEMIAQAPRDPRITYWVAEAEDSGIEDHLVDLVTVASAIHWFDLDRFYAEVRRVVKPGGVIAAWTYYTPVFGSAIDAVISRLVHDVLGAYWDKRLHYVVDEFHDLPFPFEPIEAPPFQTDMKWDMQDLLAYFETWSSSVKYREANHARPTTLIESDLARAWGDPHQKRDMHFPLYIRLGECRREGGAVHGVDIRP